MQKRLLASIKTACYTKNTLCLILFCFTFSCSEDQNNLTPLSTDATILAFGDSLTYGTGANDGLDYPTQLSKLINLPVINAGIAGEISKDGLARLPALLDKHQPHLVILIHGGNDILNKLPRKDMMHNLLSMIKHASDRGIQVIILGVPEPGLFLSSAKVYEEIAKQTGIPAELNLLAAIISNNSLKSDTVHPNAMGYQILAEGIFKFLQQKGAIL